MCGIAGLVDRTRRSTALALRDEVTGMANAIAHRGPDDHGSWCSPEIGLAISHRRLAIQDLTPSGHQPMASRSGRYVTVFNGEIYNFLSLRAELSDPQVQSWRGHSDTEVLLAGFDCWGIERTLQKANGMFAIAVVDREARTLVLARDRMGEKPLYYGWQGHTFFFASELKALVGHGSFRGTVDSMAVQLYFRFGYVPTPRSIFNGISKLPPGCLLSLDLDAKIGAAGRLIQFWRLPLPVVTRPADLPSLAEEAEVLLRDAVRLRMQADVPLGAFLSGGIDSSTVVALMQAERTAKIRTFSIGFQERAHDESAYAATVANVLGTDHTKLTVTAADALAVIPQLPATYDEPFADSSQIPTCLLAKLTRQHVTVALSGDGGDELFGGYNRYFHGVRLLTVGRIVPLGMRSALARVLRGIPQSWYDASLGLLPPGAASKLNGERIRKFSDIVTKQNVNEIYKSLVSQWQDVGEIIRVQVAEPETVLDDPELITQIGNPTSWMMYVDQATYLPDDILVKLDRASMAVALEARVPFLDYRLVEFTSQIPLSAKIHGSVGKLLLRRMLSRYIASSMFDRPKQGFGIPMARWLKGTLREWAESLLSESALKSSGYVNARVAHRAWQEHVSGRRDLHYPLWTLLMFQSWWAAYQPR